MEQVSSRRAPNDVTESLPRVANGLVLSPLQLLRSFEGLPAKPAEEPLRRRRNPVGDLETTHTVPLQQLHGVEPTSHDEDAPQPEHAPHNSSIIILTVNRLCRIFTIAVLGCWGGWSIMPAEIKAPLSVTWVTYICIITDWVVLSTVLDCTFPRSMDWYFRKWPAWWFLDKKNLPHGVSVTGYAILNTVIGLGIAFFKYAMQNDQPVLTRTDVVAGSLVFVGLYWLGRVKEDPESSCAWFFYTDYSSPIFHGVRSLSALTTWWWIAFRIHGIVNVLRNRDKPEMAVQFQVLVTGLTIEFVLLVWFFAIPFFPYFFKGVHWNRPLWSEHFPPLVAMVVSWVLVVVFGLWVDLPNIFFPCSGSQSMICKALIRYAD